MTRADQVLRHLAAAGPSIRADISAATGIPPEPLGGLLYRMHKAGDIRRADEDHRLELPGGHKIPVAVWIGVTVPPPEDAPPDGVHGPIVQQALARLPMLHAVWFGAGMTRARSDVADIDADLTAALRTIRDALQPQDGTPEDDALCAVETFAAVALRLMRRANPSVLRDCARTVEIQARIDGLPVLRGAA